MHYDIVSKNLILLVEEYEIKNKAFVMKLYRLEYHPTSLLFEHFAALKLPEELVLVINERTRPLQKIISCQGKLHILIGEMGKEHGNSTTLYSFTASSGNVTNPYDFDNSDKELLEFRALIFQ